MNNQINVNEIIEKKFQQLKGDTEYFLMGGNVNMVDLLMKDTEELVRLEKEINYFTEYDNENMVKLLVMDVERLG